MSCAWRLSADRLGCLTRESVGRYCREHSGQGHAAGDEPALYACELAQTSISRVG
jgi:hypothetical protein